MKHINKMSDRELIDYEYSGAPNEGGTSDLASELAYRFDNLISKRKSVKYNVNKLIKKVHKQNKKAGWWNDLYSGKDLTNKKGEPYVRNVSELLIMVHSEVTEAFEGYRSHLMDIHLPQYNSLTVELADAVIRIFDIAGGLKLPLAEAIQDKLEYNKNRSDHKKEKRLLTNGKKF